MASRLQMERRSSQLLEVGRGYDLCVPITDRCAVAEDLNEEDQQLKSELDMLVERLTVRLTLVDGDV